MNYPQDESSIDLGRFFQEHHRALERFIALRVGGSGSRIAEDIAAETFCQLIAYCQRAEQPIELTRALMFKIARRRLAEHYERLRKTMEVPLEDAPPVIAAGSIPATVDARRDLETALAALAALRDEYREVIVLHAKIGLSIRELSEMLEKPEPHIRVLLFRARRALKRELRKREERKNDHQKMCARASTIT